MQQWCEVVAEYFNEWLEEQNPHHVEWLALSDALEDWIMDFGDNRLSGMKATNGNYSLFLQAMVLILNGWSQNPGSFNFQTPEGIDGIFTVALSPRTYLLDPSWFENQRLDAQATARTSCAVPDHSDC